MFMKNSAFSQESFKLSQNVKQLSCIILNVCLAKGVSLHFNGGEKVIIFNVSDRKLPSICKTYRVSRITFKSLISRKETYSDTVLPVKAQRY